MSTTRCEAEITIQMATRADFYGVACVFAEENRYHAELVPADIQIAEPITTAEWYEKILSDPKRTLLVAKSGDNVVGVLLLREMNTSGDPILRPRRYAYVDEITVASDNRGQGIGRRLMEHAEAWARERELEAIELNVWEANRPAIAFYERLGYAPVRRRMRRDLGRR